jgi:hypothetical protein
MASIMMILPRNGHKYGFPKPVHEEYHTLGKDFDLKRWLISEGYPAELIPEDGSLAVEIFAEYWPDNPGEYYAN